MSAGVMTSRAVTSSPRPGAYRSSVFTTRSPSRSRSEFQSPSRSRYGAAWASTLTTCWPSGARLGSARDGIVISMNGSSAILPYFAAS